METAADPQTRIVVLGASGLIGTALVEGMRAEGFDVSAVARRFSRAQRARFGATAIEASLVSLTQDELAAMIAGTGAAVVVNCVGALQDGPGGDVSEVHRGFVLRLVGALRAQAAVPLLVHFSIPGREADDATGFARTKRDAERAIGTSGLPFVILRPGFVVTANAFGGSALMRAMAALPFDLPARLKATEFAVTAMGDLVATVAHIAHRFVSEGERPDESWDVLSPKPTTVGLVLDALRDYVGGPRASLALPRWALAAGARLGDIAGWLGWSPPVRSTALAELERGVAGDPARWIAATGIAPRGLTEIVGALPLSIQEHWFARLYLLKAVVIAGLSAFWIVSGLIALFPAYGAARQLLLDIGLAGASADIATVGTSLADIAIGALIAQRRTCRIGLWAGIAVAVAYMAGAAILAPALWADPLGAMVKTGPVVLLMLAGLAVLNERP